MRSSPSSFCTHSSSSSSSNSLGAANLTKRLKTVFKKASELTTLCDIEACVIHYGPDGELKTWPEDEEKVRDMALRYSQLDEAKRRKKSVNLYGFLKKKNKTKSTNLKKKAKTNVNELKYPISDQISQLIHSLELNSSILQERRRFLEAQKQSKTNLEDHQGALKHQQLQTQSLNPSQFSLFMYNHGDSTLSQIPLSGLKNHELYGCVQKMCMSDVTNNNNSQHPCVSNTQDYPALPSELQESVNSYRLNHMMQQELYGCDQKMCTSDITNSSNFQHPCVSNTQDYSALKSELQESVNSYGLNHLMQQELHGHDQNICTSDITNSSVLGPCLSNTVSDELCSEFQDPYGNMVGNTSFPQDVQFDESSLLQTSTLPSLHTIPNS